MIDLALAIIGSISLSWAPFTGKFIDSQVQEAACYIGIPKVSAAYFLGHNFFLESIDYRSPVNISNFGYDLSHYMACR